MFTLRSSQMGTHKWEISFPGGKESNVDEGDIVKTAIRESIEEIGISEKIIQPFGSLKPITSNNGNLAVYPVLSLVHLNFNSNAKVFYPNTSEVEDIFLLPIREACNPKHWHYTRWKHGIVTPVYYDKVFNGIQVPRIWGLTAGLLYFIMHGLALNHFRVSLPIKIK